MINLALTILPVLITFSVAALQSSPSEAHRRSETAHRGCPTPCHG
ncbi:MAG: hypothetical protein WB439_08585 [Acidobacteriaceae bacterium]